MVRSRMLTTLRALFVTDPLIVLATMVMGTVSLVASLVDGTGRAQHRVACAWGRMLLKIAGVKLRIEGLERITAGGTYVFVSNHLSYMDIPSILPSIPVQFRFMAKKSLWKVPFIGYHLRRAGHIPVEREDARAALKTMAEAARIVRESGVSVLVFPEGGRSPAGLREFKEGAAYIAIKAGVPAVPIGLTGTRQVLTMGSLLVRPGQVTLRIGEPIPTTGLGPHDRRRLALQLRGRVVKLTQPAARN
jgi:1-acyl-sn-glycerol-3-phosphate acyltransferase